MSLEKLSVDRFFIDNHICLCAVITGKPEVYSCAHAWLLWQRSELQEEDEEDKNHSTAARRPHARAPAPHLSTRSLGQEVQSHSYCKDKMLCGLVNCVIIEMYNKGISTSSLILFSTILRPAHHFHRLQCEQTKSVCSTEMYRTSEQRSLFTFLCINFLKEENTHKNSVL